jgi:hypothetical protein
VKQALPYTSWSYGQTTIKQSKVVCVFAMLLGHISPAVAFVQNVVRLLHLENVCCKDKT